MLSFLTDLRTDFVIPVSYFVNCAVRNYILFFSRDLVPMDAACALIKYILKKYFFVHASTYCSKTTILGNFTFAPHFHRSFN